MNRSRALSLLYVAPFLAAALWLFAGLVVGERTLFLRDVFNTHLEMKSFQAEAMRSGELPMVDPLRSGGQPHLGNPNTVPLYPDNLLFLVAPAIWALNAHFWIHFLLAPLAFYWLGREVGLGRAASWAAGVFYATSGYYLSTLNLYNLTASTTLTPALVAAAIAAGRAVSPRRGLVGMALVWALLVLGGDPMIAVVALVAATVAALRVSPKPASGLVRLASPVAIGSLIAAPQAVEFLRIAPGSYRGIQGYSVDAATAASWSPVNLLEWVVPLAFGEPDLLYWGSRFHAGGLPLLYSMYPGLVVLALVAASRASGRWARWCWAMVGVGIFFAMGSYNPLATWLLSLPGMSIFRLPVKLWVLTAVGLSLLAGLGLERFLEGRDSGRLRRALLALGGLLVGAASLLLLARGWVAGRIAELMRAGTSDARVAVEVDRWTLLVVASLTLVVVSVLVVHWLDGRRRLAAGWLLALHVAGQVAFLSPLAPTDEVAAYAEPAPLLASLPADARVVHGDAGGLFGPARVDPSLYPDAGLEWLQRDTFAQLYPPAGTLAGRRYDLWASPEGLDSFLTRLVAQALPLLDDARRLALLEASGVTHLLLGRDLQGVGADRVRLLRREAAGTADLRLYRLRTATPEVFFVGRLLRSGDPRRGLLLLTDPTFDPTSATVLGSAGPPSFGGPGRVEVIESGPESLRLRVDAAGPGAVVVQRTYLPIWVAEIDGREVDVELANLHRMAVRVPAGRHEVRLRVERGSLASGLVLSLLGLVLLALRARSTGRASEAQAA